MPERNTEKANNTEIQFVIFRLDNEEFGLDISQVKEIIRMQNITPMPQAPESIDGVINLRGQIITVMNLAKKLNLKENEITDKTRIVVSEGTENTIGLIVDEVPEVLKIPTNDIDPTPASMETQIHAEFINGIGKRDDRLIILLDINKILTPKERKEINGSTTENEI